MNLRVRWKWGCRGVGLGRGACGRGVSWVGRGILDNLGGVEVVDDDSVVDDASVVCGLWANLERGRWFGGGKGVGDEAGLFEEDSSWFYGKDWV